MKVKCLFMALVFACPFLYSQNPDVPKDGGSGISEPRATAEIVEEKRAKTARHEKSITRLRWKNAGATSKESPNLKVMAWISTRFVTKGDVPLANMEYIIYLLDGSTIKDKTDGDGYVRLRKMKRGKYFISIAD